MEEGTNMKFGIFTVSIPDYEPEEALLKAAEIGYDGLEWRVCSDNGNRTSPGFWSGNRTSMTAQTLIEKADILRRIAGELNLAMPSIASYIDCFDPEVELHLEAAAAIGAGNVRIGCRAYDPVKSFWDQMSENAEQYAAVAEKAAGYGVKAVIETHHGTLTPTVLHAMQLLRKLNPKHVGIMFDPGNQVYEGRERFDMALSTAGEYLAEIHIKNSLYRPCRLENNHLVWKPEWAQLRFGMVDLPELFRILKKYDYQGWCMLEDFSTELPLPERLTDNLAYLRSLL